AHIRRAAPEHVRFEVDRCLEARGPAGRDVTRSLRSPDAAKLLAELLAALWSELLAPSWRQIRDCLERDVLHRSRAMATGGLAAVFEDLAPFVALEQARLTVRRHTPHIR